MRHYLYFLQRANQEDTNASNPTLTYPDSNTVPCRRELTKTVDMQTDRLCLHTSQPPVCVEGVHSGGGVGRQGGGGRGGS